MRHLLLLAVMMVVASCSLNTGPHVTYGHVDVLKYYCNYSDHWYSQDRTIAMCDTQQECNDKCAALRP